MPLILPVYWPSMSMDMKMTMAMETQLQHQFRIEDLRERARRIYIDQVCERVREAVLERLDNLIPPGSVLEKLKGIRKGDINAEMWAQLILHILSRTAHGIEELMKQELPHTEYLAEIERITREELESVFEDNLALNTLGGDSISNEYKLLYRQSDHMNGVYEGLMKGEIVEEQLNVKHLDLIEAWHDQRTIQARKAFALANKKDNPNEDFTQQVFVEKFQVDRKIIEEGLADAETHMMHTKPVVVGDVLLSPNGTLLGFTILQVFSEKCDEKGRKPLLSYLDRGYSGGGLQYFGRKKGVEKKNGFMKAAREGKPFVILMEIGAEQKGAATLTASAAYRRIFDQGILQTKDFIGLSYYQRSVRMSWKDSTGIETDLFGGIEDPPGKNDAGEAMMKKLGMGQKAGPFGSDFDLKNKKKIKTFSAEDGGQLTITTEWNNVSGTGEKIMQIAEQFAPPSPTPAEESSQNSSPHST